MLFSRKIKSLMLLAIVILLLALAAVDSTKDLPKPLKPFRKGLNYPQVPLDLDPQALDYGTVAPVATPRVKTPVIAAPRTNVSAEAYLVGNLETGQVYFEHDSSHVYPIASLSKLFTALVAIHSMAPDKQVEITEPVLAGYGDAGHFTLGEKFTIKELLNPLLLESSNDAAEGIAQSYGYENFIAQMNVLASNLNLPSTSFKDASGLSSGNISNAQDLFKLARYLYQNEKPLLELTRQTVSTVASTTDHSGHTWKTINPFPFDPHFIGGKTGRTNEARESMVSLFNYSANNIIYPVAVIVLRSDFSDRETDSSLLFERFIRTVDSSI